MTFGKGLKSAEDTVSIHATLAGGDGRAGRHNRDFFSSFYPRHPRGWRQTGPHWAERSQQGFYPRHPRGWRQCCCLPTPRLPWRFYPRHPRGWRRNYGISPPGNLVSFYPRHPRGWRRKPPRSGGCSCLFLSTPPSRVATTQHFPDGSPYQTFLSTPPSRVATGEMGGADSRCEVSIHATLAGGDTHRMRYKTVLRKSFYPRHPRGWRPPSRPPGLFYPQVSIHATLAGGDSEPNPPTTILS